MSRVGYKLVIQNAPDTTIQGISLPELSLENNAPRVMAFSMMMIMIQYHH
jgi:hypothetical protein